MSQATISFRINKDIKESMEQTCKDMGLTMTSAFTVFAKKVADEQKIPFEISAKKSTPVFIEDINREQLENKLLKGIESIENEKAISQDQLIKNMKAVIN